MTFRCSATTRRGDESPTQAVTAPSPVADWQVDLLRKALDAQGLTGMTERRSAVENAVGRQVESLRQLSSEEALSALSKLGGSSSASGSDDFRLGRPGRGHLDRQAVTRTRQSAALSDVSPEA